MQGDASVMRNRTVAVDTRNGLGPVTDRFGTWTAPPAGPAAVPDRAALSAIRLLFDRGFYLAAHPDVAASGIDPLDHFLTCGLAEGRSPCVLFDPEFYLGQPGAPDTRDGLFLHYLTVGIGLGLDPHPLVMAGHYAAQAPRLPAGTNPLTHMLGVGRRENRRPNPLFDPAFYRRRLRGGSPSQHPLAHYAQSGWLERLQPHPLFDPAAYLAQRDDIEAAGLDPLAHYLRHGRYEAARPNWLFDAAHYAARCPEPVEPRDALLHLACHGSGPGRSPSPLFDAAHYGRQHPDLVATGADPFLHFLEFGLRDNRDPHPLFDTAFYRSHNPDVADADMPPFVHYVRFGAREGRDPNPCFPARAYLGRHPDAAAEPGGPLAHFLRTPDAHLDRLGDGFNPRYYLDCYPGCRDAVAAGVSPLAHYLAVGRANRLSPLPLPLDGHGWSVPATPPAADHATATAVLLVLADASRCDATLCALHAVREMVADAALECRVVIRGGGALVPAFAALAPTSVVGSSQGSDAGGGTDRMAAILHSFRERPGGVVIATGAALGDVVALAGRLRLRLLAWLHETPISIDSLSGGPEMMGALVELGAPVVVNAPAARDALLRRYRLSSRQVTVIGDGMAPPSPGLDARTAALSLRELLELPPDALVVLGGGAVAFRGGTDLFVRVAAQVLSQVPRRPALAGTALAQAYFIWFGTADDRLFAALCRNDIDRLGLSDRVRLLELPDGPAQVPLGADLFLHTAREAATGIAVAEARHIGLPVIGFSGCADDAAPLDGGTVVPFLDLDAMAEAVLLQGCRPARRAGGSRPRPTAGPGWADWHLALRCLLSDRLGVPAPVAASADLTAIVVPPPPNRAGDGVSASARSGNRRTHDPLPIVAATSALPAA